MKRRFLSLLTLSVLWPAALFAQKLVFTPQWTPQTQFAGYYAALEKGFYKEAGLDVEIRHTSVNSIENPVDMLMSGKTDIIGQQLMQGIITRAQGNPLVNVMQITQASGLWCVAHRPIHDISDLNGMKIATWKVGFNEFCRMMEKKLDLQIEWVPFISGISLFVYGAVDATLCFSYNEYISLLLATGGIPEENILKFKDFGYVCPEDGLYTSEDYYRKNKFTVQKFVSATERGWTWCRTYKQEALDICMKYVREAGVITNLQHQKMMLDEYLSLMVNPATGHVDFAPIEKKLFDTINDALVDVGSIDRAVDYDKFVK